MLFLKQKVVNHALKLNVKQRVAVRNFHRFHAQLDVFSPLVNHQVPVKEFIPHFGFGGVFPLAVDLHDATASTTNPRDVFGHLGQHRPCSQARLIIRSPGGGSASQKKFAISRTQPLV